MVAIPSYRGPTEWYNDDGIPMIPIVPSIALWEKNGKPCSRKQYPLRLAYAISIHKYQGMTLRKIVIELGISEFWRELSFCRNFSGESIKRYRLSYSDWRTKAEQAWRT